MKKALLISSVLLSGLAVAQNTPVSQQQEASMVLIEEFTGINCPNCPNGHALANNYLSQIPTKLAVINYHASSFANPNTGEPDFRTTDGTALFSFFGLNGTPSGPVNRENFTASTFQVSANDWLDNINSELTVYQNANTAIDVSINTATRTATIDVEVFYTNPPSGVSNAYLTVAMVENGIIGPQQNGSSNSDNYNAVDGTYRHDHVFRAFVDSREGELFDATQPGVINFQYTYVIPTTAENTTIDINNLEFIAIAHKGENTASDSEIVSLAKTEPTLTSAGTEEIEKELSISAFPNPSNGSFTLQNLQQGDNVKVVNLARQNIPFNLNNNQIELKAEAGMYIVSVVRGNVAQSMRIIIK